MSTCVTCQPLDCDSLVDSDNLYSLDRIIFPYVTICPPGQDCFFGDTVTLYCCDEVLVGHFTSTMTLAQKLALLQDLVNKCAIAIGFCGQNVRTDTPTNDGDAPPPFPPSDPNLPPHLPPPPYLMFSNPTAASFPCPNGGTYFFQLHAGAIGKLFPYNYDRATAQREVDLLARQKARADGFEAKFCVDTDVLCYCTEVSGNRTLQIRGGTGPFIAIQDSGYIPLGTSISVAGRTITVSATPETPGTFLGVLKVIAPDGNYWLGPLNMSAITIGYGRNVSSPFVIPSISSTVAVTLSSQTQLSVGDTISFAQGTSGITDEYGTFTVSALDTPAPGQTTVTNVTGIPGATVPAGATAYFTISDIPDFVHDDPYSFQLPGVGGSGSYAFTYSGTIPVGITVSSTGLISGTPTGSPFIEATFTISDTAC